MKSKSGFSRFLTVRWILIIIVSVFAIIPAWSELITTLSSPYDVEMFQTISEEAHILAIIDAPCGFLSILLLIIIGVLLECKFLIPSVVLAIVELIAISIDGCAHRVFLPWLDTTQGILLLLFVLLNNKTRNSIFGLIWPITTLIITGLRVYVGYHESFGASFAPDVLIMLVLCHGISMKEIFSSIHTKPTQEKPMNITTVPSKAATKSKVTAALLAFFVGGIGGHRYYLGYIEKGIMQTCGCISVVVGYMTMFNNIAYGSASGLMLSIVLLLAGAVCYIWAFIDFIRILTGSLAPADGSGYKENLAAQAQMVQANTKPGEYAATLEKLAALHKQGILSDEEFQQKKTELLEKI